jgi:hypothetical protein
MAVQLSVWAARGHVGTGTPRSVILALGLTGVPGFVTYPAVRDDLPGHDPALGGLQIIE